MICAVLLAAGTSSRMGRHKLLLDLDGKPLVVHAVDAALAGPLDQLVVVLGRDPDEVREILPSDPRVRSVVNERFETGQASSLVAGLEAADPDADAAVILLGDQPEVRTEAIAAVVDAFGRDPVPVVQASYSGRPAHPILFSRATWPDLQRLEGDRGARDLLEARTWERRLVEVGGDPPEDIDTDDDYERARSRLRQKR